MAVSRKHKELLTAIAGTAALTGVGGAIAPLAGLPAAGAAALCGLPMAVAAAVADRRRGIAAAIVYGLATAAASWRDFGSLAALGTSAFVVASAGATVAIATARRRRQERTVVGLERLNHQILGDVSRRSEVAVESHSSVEAAAGRAASLTALHEAGKRISTYLDTEAAVPVVITAARTTLKCRDAAVFLWDGRNRTLVEALPTRTRDVGRYVPDPDAGAAGWVIATRQIYTAAAADSNHKLAAATDCDSRRPAGVAPLVAGAELLGLLIVDRLEEPDPSFGNKLSVLASLAALSMKNAQLARRLEDASLRDPLTGLLNRSGLEAVAETTLRSAPEGTPVVVLVADLNRFEEVNEEFGSPAGDAVLQEAARLWRAALPEEAVVARLGGARFAALLSDCELEHGKELAESVRDAVASHPFLHDGHSIVLTASLGVADLGPDGASLDELFRKAEHSLDHPGDTRGSSATSEAVAN